MPLPIIEFRMPHKVTLPALDLQIGMFVMDLDRPWIETPFLLQGFLIESDAQIAALQHYCAHVVIDRSRSIGSAYAARDYGKDAPLLPAKPADLTQPDDAQANDFAKICHELRVQPFSRRFRLSPAVDPSEQQSRLEPELLYSAPIVDDIKRSLKAIRDSFNSPQSVALNEVASQVGELARGVERNPDAMIWLARLRSTDQYSYDHAVDVSVLLMVFARFLGMPAKTIELIGLAGLMQDIGKVDIPADILNKPDTLTDEEYRLVQSHVASSLEMLVGHQDFPTTLLKIVASHHERADGSGYPRRLKGERICFHGELAGVVDTYAAMTRQRVYEKAVSSQKALEALIKMRGSKFREPVVDQFIQCIGLYPVGSLVELNTGEVGVVIQQNQVRRLKPRLLIILGPDKSVERYPVTLDLMKDPESSPGVAYRITHALPADAYGIDPAEFYLV